MWYHRSEWVGLLLRVGLTLCLCLIVGSYEPAMASVHTYPEASGQVMYRSQQSLRDASGKAWQAVLFKRLKLGQVECVHLRLVGFPGITELAHPRQLQITTRTGEVWTAADVGVESSLPPNVGEYDILEVINQLNSNIPLWLDLPLKNDRSVELLVPPFAVQEWRSLVNHSEL